MKPTELILGVGDRLATRSGFLTTPPAISGLIINLVSGPCLDQLR